MFLGYSPLIIGLFFDDNDEIIPFINSSECISLSFNTNNFEGEISSKNNLKDKNNIARLILKPLGEKNFSHSKLLLFEGISGNHQFISAFQKFNNNLKTILKKNKNGNVSLPGNLYDQVRIAYSIPRRISLISLSDGKDFNMFPTDLHGRLNDNLYVISLRHNGKASKQVENYGNITLSSVSLSFCRQTYSLGKNHMKELQPPDAFSLYTEKSVNWGNLLPSGVFSYLELERIHEDKPVLCGIHQLHFFRIIHKQIIQKDASTLSHVHNYYAQWRINQGLPTEYVLR